MDALAQSLIQAVRRHRHWLLAIAALVFVGGIAASLHQLDFEFSRLRLQPTAVIFFVMGPVSLSYGATGLWLLSRGSNVTLSFKQAFHANCAAQLAEVLPIPGGAIIRTGALVAAGARVGRSAALVTLGAVLWIAIATGAAGIALQQITGDVRFSALSVGSVAIVGLTLWQLARLTGSFVAFLLFSHRVVGCALIAARLVLAFAAIGVPQSIASAFIFSLANVAGSAAAIAPAGLGISELFAAAIATAIGVDPFAAFLALALNRVLGTASNGVAFILLEAVNRNSDRR